MSKAQTFAAILAAMALRAAILVMNPVAPRLAGAEDVLGLVPLTEDEDEEARLKARGLPVAATKTRPDCAMVMREVNRQVRQDGGTPVGAAKVAKKLGTEVAWVEQCMQVYGRRTAEKSAVSEADRDILEEARELGDEVPPIDTDAVDADVPPPPPTPLRERHEKLSLKPTRVPGYAPDKEE